MDEPRLHLIGHAHIDPAWLWRWPEGLSEALATFRSALDRICEHPDFVFTCGSAGLYEFVERADPAMFKEIASAVDQGRWEIMGGFWVEPDTNISSGESLVRHALMSQRYFGSRFATVPKVAFNPDAFGHCAGLPQILARAGFGAYVFMRPEPGEADLPRTFWWTSGDGSGVRAYRIPVAYCTWPDTLDSHLDAVRAALRGDSAVDGMCFYGVGNHGGGPTRSNLEALDRRIALGEPLTYSSPTRYLEGQGVTAAEISGELGYHARGGYSANSAMKAAIRRTDAALVGAETAAAIARSLTGATYPAADLEAAWKILLCAGFHDVAAGTVISSAARDTLGSLAAAAYAAERITDEAHVTLAWHTALDVEEAGTALVVFNPHPWQTGSPVETEVAAGRGRLELLDDAGVAVPVQEIGSEAVADGRRRITFLASLPPGGWRVYRLRLAAGDAPDTPSGPSVWDLELDPSTGGVRSLSFGSAPVLAGSSAYTTVATDMSDTWSHGLAAYPVSEATFAGGDIKLLEDGPVRRVVRTVAWFGSSSVVQKFTVYRGWDRVRVDVTFDWNEHRRVAKLRFSVPPGSVVRAEAPYSNVARPADGDEYPGGSWVTVKGELGGGFSLANDAKFGYDVTPESLGMTVARSPLSAHHDPARPPEDGDLEFLDQGRQQFAWAVSADPNPLAAARLAAELLRPARVVKGSHHPDAPLEAGVRRLSVDGAVLGAAKRAEDLPGTVLRVHNPTNEWTTADVSFAGRSLRRALSPTEVLTLYVADDPSEPVREIPLLEG